MKPVVKKALIGVGAVVGLVAIGGGGYAFLQARDFDASMERVYDVPLPAIERSTDPQVLARGKHLVEATAACAGSDCHSSDLGGGKTIEMGPLGKLTGPNITAGGLGAVYSDAELARLIRHGIKKDGRSVRFMPVHEINWMPDSDVTAVVSYLRTVPKVDRPNGPMQLGLLAKVLDRKGAIVIDVARKIDHANIELAGAPAPTAEYGRFIARGCTGCHGETFAGGKIPGAPSDMPIPLNITPHDTGLKGWSYEDFDKLLTKGERKNGQKLNPFMPIEALGKADEIEKKALWAFLEKLPAKPFGER